MNLHEHLLTILTEEANEIGVAASKIQRFGPDDYFGAHASAPTNREKLVGELNDLLAMAELLVQVKLLPADWQNKGMQQAKQDRVFLWMGHSNRKGLLQPDGSFPLP